MPLCSLYVAARAVATFLSSVVCIVSISSLGLALAADAAPRPAEDPPAPVPRLRRPLGAALEPDGRTLWVACRSGTVLLVDVDGGRVISEAEIGRRLAAIAIHAGGHHALLLDELAHELIVATRDGATPRVHARLAVSPYPAGVAASADGSLASVASSWSRRLTIVDTAALAAPAQGDDAARESSRAPAVLHTMDLPFAPREQLFLREPLRLLVADARGGRLAIVEPRAGFVESLRELLGHNLSGLAASRDGRWVYASMQVLSDAPITLESVRLGSLMQNIVRSLSVETLLRPEADLLFRSTVLRLDSGRRGAGDPSGIGVLADDRLAVALSGVDEVGIAAARGGRPRRVAVGRRPTAVIARGSLALVVNTLSDSVSLVDPERGEVTATIALGPMPELTERDRGEIAFHDARLSRESWFSCHSCHTDGDSNGLFADTLGDDTHGTPKRVLSLLGAGDTGPWAWNGAMDTLPAQVEKSLAGTMHTEKVAEGVVADLAAFIASLAPPPPALGPPASPAETSLRARGMQVFADLGCAECHAPPAFTSADRHDVGIVDESGARRFNPPSLRGAGHQERFFHDGRATSLEDVFRVHRHRVRESLAPEDLAALVEYLRGL